MTYTAIDNSQKEISNHDNNYNMSPREYFNRKGK